MGVKISIETKRTILRNLMVEDATHFYNLNLEPEVLKYTGDEPFKTIESAEAFLANYDQFEKYSVGRFAVIEKKTLEFIGWCGLKYRPDTDEYDLGFRFFSAYWNKGYATETSKKCLDYGFKNLKIPRIVGRAMVANVASIKVLQKIGFNFKENFDFEGQEGVIYQITPTEYEMRHSNQISKI